MADATPVPQAIQLPSFPNEEAFYVEYGKVTAQFKVIQSKMAMMDQYLQQMLNQASQTPR